MDNMENNNSAKGAGPNLKYKVLLIIVWAVLLLCIGVILFNYYKSDDSSGDINTDVPQNMPYEMPRDARSSANSNILWENNFGGSGDDIFGDSFYIDGLVYIFGTTYSKDFDMESALEGSNLFVLVADENGKIYSSTVFGTGGNDLFVKACVDYTGFLILSNTDANGGQVVLYRYNSTANTFQSFTLESILARSALDMYFNGTEIAIVSNYYDTVVRKNIPYVTILSHDFQILLALDITTSANLTFVALYPSTTGYLIYTNAVEALNAYPCIIRFNKNGNYTFTEIEKGYTNARIFDVMPASVGYIMVAGEIDNTRRTKMHQISIDGNLTRTIQLPANMDAAKITSHGDGYLVALYTTLTSNTCSVYSISSTFGFNSNKLPNLNNAGKIVSFYQMENKTAILSAGLGASNKFVVSYLSIADNSCVQYTLGGNTNDTPVTLLETGSHLLAFGTTASKNGDIGYSFGSRDVWAVALRSD